MLTEPTGSTSSTPARDSTRYGSGLWTDLNFGDGGDPRDASPIADDGSGRGELSASARDDAGRRAGSPVASDVADLVEYV